MKKIFAIGFNKTGTTSFYNLFLQLGINSTHTTTPVMEIIDKFDAFTDGDHKTFDQYYNKYPDSVFILNTRPISKWLTSRYKHAKGINFIESWCWPISEGKTNRWITDRENLYTKIFDFFLDKPSQLLIINIEKPGWEEVVATFLQKPVPLKKMHCHKIELINEKDKLQLITEHVTNCLIQRGYNGCELLNKDTDIKLYKYTAFL